MINLIRSIIVGIPCRCVLKTFFEVQMSKLRCVADVQRGSTANVDNLSFVFTLLLTVQIDLHLIRVDVKMLLRLLTILNRLTCISPLKIVR